MIKWIDETSYSKSDKERSPKVWKLKSKDLPLIVHRHIHYGPDAWLVTCDPWFNRYELRTTEEEQAKAMAINLVRTRLKECLADLD